MPRGGVGWRWEADAVQEMQKRTTDERNQVTIKYKRMKREKSHKSEDMFSGLSISDRKQLADAIACALTGHPIKWKGEKVKRIWKKYVCKG